jgi:hypothetical protein
MKMHVAWSYNEGEGTQWVIAEVTKPRYQSVILGCVDELENKLECRTEIIGDLNWAIYQGTSNEFLYDNLSREEVDVIKDGLCGKDDVFIILDDVIGVYENEIDIDYREVE